jgi:hypothetical protein
MYQVSSKSLKGFRRSCEDKFLFKEKVKFRDCNSFRNNRTGLPLQYAHLHSLIFLCKSLHQGSSKSPKGFRRSCEDKVKGKGA